jgi:hypothetical protein
MRPAIGIVRGPSLYRHECVKCREETLHGARGCARCGTSPWDKPIRLKGYAHRVLTAKMKAKNW